MGTREDDIGDILENLDYYMIRISTGILFFVFPIFLFYDAHSYLGISTVSKELFTATLYLIFILILSGMYTTYRFYDYIIR